MTALNLNIRDEVLDKVLYFLESLPIQDVQIVQRRIIEEINPTSLPKEHFDYMSQAELDEMDKLVADAIKDGLENFKSLDEFKNEL